ncbi:MAG TPA: TonB-dependent receptor, partial [Chthoniobacterales bacterium]
MAISLFFSCESTAQVAASSIAAFQPSEMVPEVIVTAEEDAATSQLRKARQKQAGSIATVSPQELQLQKTNNLGDVVARVPGVAYVDEDGRGTKPDISLRGLNPIRSEFVLLLLDGVPIQPSIYSEPAAYYGPPAERLAGIEIFKGGASTLFGPNAVGGVFNFITRAPSLLPLAVVIDTRFDSYEDYSANLFVSGTRGNASAGLEYLHKGGDGFRDGLGYNINDVEAKLGYQFNNDHFAQLHFQFYDEESETPGGLLPEQFRSDRTQSNKPQDEFFGRRIALDLRSSHPLSERQQLDLLFYVFRFERDWFLQNYVSNNTPNLTLANNNSQFLRTFDVLGFEPKYTLTYDLGQSSGHQLEVGARIYYDEVDRRAATGASGGAREGDAVLTSKEDLSTLSIAAYAQNEFKITRRLSVVPGVRFEHIDQTLENVLAGTAQESSAYDVWVPGIGAKYDLALGTQLYANASRSFRPPSFADTFNPTIDASNVDLRASTAWTYEGGIRANPYTWLSADAGAFYTDFTDQVVVSAGTAANFNTTSYGFEAVSQLGLLGFAQLLRNGDPNYAGPHELFLAAGMTLLRSTFADGPFEDNDLPYVPEQTFTFGVRYAFRERFEVAFQGRYVGDRYTDNANTVQEDPVGIIGELEDYLVCDVK